MYDESSLMTIAQEALSGISKSIELRTVLNSAQGSHFFGYYDKCPWDPTGRYLLALRVPFDGRVPEPSDSAFIMVVDTEQNLQSSVVGKTNAWNWQQGAMCRWLDCDSSPQFIYNDRRGDRLVSIVRDVAGNEVRVIPYPVYDISASETVALTLSFGRLTNTRPGYGYSGAISSADRTPCPDGDGIWAVDLENKSRELLISIQNLAMLDSTRGMAGAVHWINHLTFNPSGTRFAFVHRWGRPGGSTVSKATAGLKLRGGLLKQVRGIAGRTYRRVVGRRFSGFQSRLLTARVDGSDLRCLLDDGMVSHFCWYDNRHLLAWAHRRKIGDRYWLLEDSEGGAAEVIGDGVLTRDGHCTVSNDRRWLLTDTYPDAEGTQTLILYDLIDKVRHDVAHMMSNTNLTGDVRCDLHPRFSRACDCVAVDSSVQGNRQLYVIDVSKWTLRLNP